jgi:hypothetical protein
VFAFLRSGRLPALPTPLAIAIGLVRVQAVGLVVTAAALAIDTVAGSPDQPGAAVTLAVLAAAVGVLLLWLARALAGQRLWARTPVVFLEVLFLPVAYTLLRSGYAIPGVGYLVVSLAVLVLLFTPPARAALEG